MHEVEMVIHKNAQIAGYIGYIKELESKIDVLQAEVIILNQSNNVSSLMLKRAQASLYSIRNGDAI